MIERKIILPDIHNPGSEENTCFRVQNPQQPLNDPPGSVPEDLHDLVVQLVERELQIEEETHTLHEEGSIILDEMGCITWVNLAGGDLLGPGRQYITGTGSAVSLQPGHIHRVDTFVKRVVAPGSLEVRDRGLHGTPGKKSWYAHIKGELVPSEQRENNQIRLIISDITEHKQVEVTLAQANRQLLQLNSITRHDVLNKVSFILGYLAMARKNSPDPATFLLIGKLESATLAIQTQIMFTGLYQELGTHEPQWHDLDKILPRSHIPPYISMTADVEGIFVFADPMFERVFFNLLDNSIRHSQKGEGIRMSSAQMENGLMITWEDDGVGIPVDEKERIFHRGFGKNTGLGLFFVREILSMTGITIKETGDPYIGARFEIMVPKGMYRIVKPGIPTEGTT